MIRSIVEDAQNYLGEEIEEAVISVPAYFHDEQRVAVKRAGALAGIHVERIVNEPSAAALASYFTANEEQNMLVFDFGGGTLDVSLVDCFDTMVEIVSVAGNNRLGGDDFDRLIAEHFLRGASQTGGTMQKAAFRAGRGRDACDGGGSGL